MEMVQIVTSNGEVNAAIVKGFLEGAGIKTTYGPSGNISLLTIFTGPVGSMGPNQPQNVFVPKDKVEEALSLLKEQGLITSK